MELILLFKFIQIRGQSHLPVVIQIQMILLKSLILIWIRYFLLPSSLIVKLCLLSIGTMYYKLIITNYAVVAMFTHNWTVKWLDVLGLTIPVLSLFVPLLLPKQHVLEDVSGTQVHVYNKLHFVVNLWVNRNVTLRKRKVVHGVLMENVMLSQNAVIITLMAQHLVFSKDTIYNIAKNQKQQSQ